MTLDNLSGQIFQSLFIVWPEGLVAIDVEAAVMLAHHIIDDKIGDHSLFFEQAKTSRRNESSNSLATGCGPLMKRPVRALHADRPFS